MLFKNLVEVKTTEDSYKEIVLKRAIVLCWALLFICLILKSLGLYYFDIVCNNERFIKICIFIDDNLWLKFIIGSISSLIMYSLFYLAICKNLWFNTKDLIITIITTLTCVILRLLISNSILKLIINILQCFIIPLILTSSYRCFGWHIRRVIIGNVLNIVFQIISAIIKNVNLSISLEHFLIGIIFSIDVLIMLALYYLYSNKKIGGKHMSWILDWLFGKSDSQLEKMKKN